MNRIASIILYWQNVIVTTKCQLRIWTWFAKYLVCILILNIDEYSVHMRTLNQSPHQQFSTKKTAIWKLSLPIGSLDGCFAFTLAGVLRWWKWSGQTWELIWLICHIKWVKWESSHLSQCVHGKDLPRMAVLISVRVLLPPFPAGWWRKKIPARFAAKVGSGTKQGPANVWLPLWWIELELELSTGMR